MKPTDEQVEALDMFRRGDSMVIEAGAGTGKTSSVKMLAGSTRDKGLYCAFNKAVVEDAKAVMPRNVKVCTFHALAYGAVGWKFKERLGAPRVRSETIARALSIDAITLTLSFGEKRLSPGYLGGHVLKALNVFCQTADPEPTVRHFPYIDGIDLPAPDGTPRYDANNLVAKALLPALQDAWHDVQNPKTGFIPFGHQHYLKQFALTDPQLPYDFFMVDEAQDLSPVLAGIVEAQTGTQLCLVGDSQQAIYGFLSAVNAMENLPITDRTFLTLSFRFGEEIAGVANTVLSRLHAPLRLRGGGRPGVIGPITNPDTLLARSNASCVRRALTHIGEGGRPAIVGGADDVIWFAEAAEKLQDGMRTDHPELACFESWAEVQTYVSSDANGSDLALMVRLIDDFGADEIIDGLRHCTSESDATLIVSTAHRSKGREWDAVQLADDFPTGMKNGEPVEVPDEELRLLYVAATRAKLALDTADNPLLEREAPGGHLF